MRPSDDPFRGRLANKPVDANFVRSSLVLDLGAPEALPVDAREEGIRFLYVQPPPEDRFVVAARASLVRPHLRTCQRTARSRAGGP